MWGSLEIRTMLKQGVIIVVCKPMTSRNTAPRLSIDFGPGCFPWLNKSDISPQALAELMAGLQLLAPCPRSKVMSFLCSGQIQHPDTCLGCSGCPSTLVGGYREDSSCKVGAWPKADALSLNLGQAQPEKQSLNLQNKEFDGDQRKRPQTSSFQTLGSVKDYRAGINHSFSYWIKFIECPLHARL